MDQPTVRRNQPVGGAVFQRARHEAEQILAAQSIGPVGLDDLIEIAEQWNASVSVVPLDRSLSGFIIKESGTDPRIYINSLDSPERQRFTLAHEIGHLVEREAVAGDRDYSFVDTRKQGRYDLHEFFADEFAGALLMPTWRFLKSYQEHGAFKTAVDFGVSVPAVKRRLARLQKNPPVVPSK